MRPWFGRRDVQQHRGEHQAEDGADHAQQAEVEGSGEVWSQHDGSGHRQPVAVRQVQLARDEHGQTQTYGAANGMTKRDGVGRQAGAQRG